MVEPEKQNCQFFLLRYVPDAVKNEFVNFGLVLLPPAAPAEMRFAKDWSRVRGLDPQADLEALEALEDDLRGLMRETAGKELVLKKIADSFSNALQASEPQACLTASPAREADELAGIYLESARGRPPRDRSARQIVFHRMRREFTLTGAWEPMRKNIPVAQYTRQGDPLKIDCGYQSRSVVKMFHATPLRKDLNAAKVLAFSFPKLAEGIRQAEGVAAELTAIVEEGLEQHAEGIGFALETLERHAIRVASVDEMPALAALAAREIGGL